MVLHGRRGWGVAGRGAHPIRLGPSMAGLAHQLCDRHLGWVLVRGSVRVCRRRSRISREENQRCLKLHVNETFPNLCNGRCETICEYYISTYNPI